MSYGGVAAAVAIMHEREEAYRAGASAAINEMERDPTLIDSKYNSHQDNWFKGYDDLLAGKIYSPWQPKKKTPLSEKVLLVLLCIAIVLLLTLYG